MKKLLSLTGGSVVLLCAALLSGCGPSKPPGEAGTAGGGGKAAAVEGAPSYRIITNGISPFWNPMEKGMEDEKAVLKVNATWGGPDPAENPQQIRLFQDAVSAKADGIAVSAIDAIALVPTINSAVDAGIPVITFDSDAPTSKRLAYIGTNNFEAGRVAGQETVKLFPAGAKLVAFVGNMTAQNARERYDGFKEAIKGHNIEFLQEPYTDEKKADRARQNADDAITKYQGRVNGFVGLYSYNGPAIVKAVQSAGIRDKIKIICFDGEPETLKNLQHGLVDVTVVQKPYEFGRLSIMLLDRLKKNKNDIKDAIEQIKPALDKLDMKVNGVNIDTGVDVITPANAPAFMQKLKEKGLEST